MNLSPRYNDLSTRKLASSEESGHWVLEQNCMTICTTSYSTLQLQVVCVFSGRIRRLLWYMPSFCAVRILFHASSDAGQCRTQDLQAHKNVCWYSCGTVSPFYGWNYGCIKRYDIQVCAPRRTRDTGYLLVYWENLPSQLEFDFKTIHRRYHPCLKERQRTPPVWQPLETNEIA